MNKPSRNKLTSTLPREEDGLIRINHDQLMRKLRLRGKALSALRTAGVSFDTIAKIKRGQPVQARILQKITVQLVEWPELEHAADLLNSE